MDPGLNNNDCADALLPFRARSLSAALHTPTTFSPTGRGDGESIAGWSGCKEGDFEGNRPDRVSGQFLVQGDQARFELARLLMQLRVLHLEFFQDGNVRVGVLRERKEVGMHSSLVPRRLPWLRHRMWRCDKAPVTKFPTMPLGFNSIWNSAAAAVPFRARRSWTRMYAGYRKLVNISG
jgi:hypothetical protein